MIYDPKDLGFMNDSRLYYAFKLDTTLHGNSNQGHEWGTELSDPEKDALIEFLKAYDFEDPAMRALKAPAQTVTDAAK
jgi:hypothetical protein